MQKKIPEYPCEICNDCGNLYGKDTTVVSTYHYGVCAWCKKEVAVTEPRDFGYPSFQPKKEKTRG
jgi:hypothetical protein